MSDLKLEIGRASARRIAGSFPAVRRRSIRMCDSAASSRPRPTDRGVEKPTKGRPHAPLDLAILGHARMPPRPESRSAFAAALRAALVGVLTPREGASGLPAGDYSKFNRRAKIEIGPGCRPSRPKIIERCTRAETLYRARRRLRNGDQKNPRHRPYFDRRDSPSLDGTACPALRARFSKNSRASRIATIIFACAFNVRASRSQSRRFLTICVNAAGVAAQSGAATASLIREVAFVCASNICQRSSSARARFSSAFNRCSTSGMTESSRRRSWQFPRAASTKNMRGTPFIVWKWCRGRRLRNIAPFSAKWRRNG